MKIKFLIELDVASSVPYLNLNESNAIQVVLKKLRDKVGYAERSTRYVDPDDILDAFKLNSILVRAISCDTLENTKDV